MNAVFYCEIVDLGFKKILVFIDFHSQIQLKSQIRVGSSSAAETFSKNINLQVFQTNVSWLV